MPNYIPATPSSLATLGAAGMRKIIFSSKVKFDSVRSSVFTTPELAADYTLNRAGEMIVTKKGVILNVENLGEARTAQSVRCAMRTGLRKRARYGTGEQMLGNEDEGGLLWTEFFYNEIKKASKMYMFGYDFNDTDYLDLNAGNAKLLSSFHAENDDTRFQQAIIVQYADELTYAPISRSPQFNPNWLIPNLAYANNPAFDHTPTPTVTAGAVDADLFYPSQTYSGATSFVENIGAALTAAAGVAATPKAVLNVDHCSAIKTYMMDYHVVEPLELGGITGPGWIWKIGPKTAGYMLNPQISGSFGSNFVSTAAYGGDLDRDLVPGEIGILFGHFVVVVDWRTPTLTLSGATGSYSLKLGYIQPSNNDDRNNDAWDNTSGSTNYAFEMNSILGNMALARYVRDDMKAGLSETTEYGQIKGAGTYKGEGIQLPIFNVDTPTATSHIYRGSVLTPHSIANIDTVA